MPYYILNRTYNLHTTLGGVSFVKGEPAWVIPPLEKAVISIGAVRAEGETPEIIEDAPPPKIAPTGSDRNDSIFTAFQIIMDRNEAKDFTAAGVPTIKAVEKLTEFDVDRTEIIELWGEFKVMQAEAQ